MGEKIGTEKIAANGNRDVVGQPTDVSQCNNNSRKTAIAASDRRRIT